MALTSILWELPMSSKILQHASIILLPEKFRFSSSKILMMRMLMITFQLINLTMGYYYNSIKVARKFSRYFFFEKAFSCCTVFEAELSHKLCNYNVKNDASTSFDNFQELVLSEQTSFLRSVLFRNANAKYQVGSTID